MFNITETKTPNETNFVRKDVHQQVTDSIIKQLEEGIVPWKQCWKTNQSALFQLPRNAVTGKAYRGINIVLLWSTANEKQFASQEWASFKQWQSKKEAIRKGEKGNFVVFTDTFEKEVDGEIKKIPFLKYSFVFNRTQLVSYSPNELPLENTEKPLVERIKVADEFIANTFASIEHREGGACYAPELDKIFLPPIDSFIDTEYASASENYYATSFHEITHWTGHHSRINRKIKNKFGNHAYAEEELIAELGSAFLGAEFNLSGSKATDHANYIGNWLKVLKDNKQFIISAASEASKAVDFLKEMQPLKFDL